MTKQYAEALQNAYKHALNTVWAGQMAARNQYAVTVMGEQVAIYARKTQQHLQTAAELATTQDCKTHVQALATQYAQVSTAALSGVALAKIDNAAGFQAMNEIRETLQVQRDMLWKILQPVRNSLFENEINEL